VLARGFRTVCAECLDWLLILGRRHLESVLRVYTTHYNGERPHRGLALLTPETGGARAQVESVLELDIHAYTKLLNVER
jgi:hypothetical protein